MLLNSLFFHALLRRDKKGIKPFKGFQGHFNTSSGSDKTVLQENNDQKWVKCLEMGEGPSTRWMFPNRHQILAVVWSWVRIGPCSLSPSVFHLQNLNKDSHSRCEDTSCGVWTAPTSPWNGDWRTPRMCYLAVGFLCFWLLVFQPWVTAKGPEFQDGSCILSFVPGRCCRKAPAPAAADAGKANRTKGR